MNAHNSALSNGGSGLCSAASEAYSEFVRRLIYPRLIRRWHPCAKHYLQELKEYEFSSMEEIEGVQFERLKKILKHAAENVPYYRNLFRQKGLQVGEIRSRKDFEQIPILTKGTLQSESDNLCAEDRDKSLGLPNASGGSTGKPVQFFQDKDYWDRAYASQWFVESWWGIRPGDRTASVWGADRDMPDQSWRERLTSELEQFRVCNAFALSENGMERFAEMLMKWQPRHITGYASALEVFARFLCDKELSRIRPRAVKATADVLDAERRKLIEKAFGCPVYNFYGSREINNLAAECPARSGLHINSLTRYIEIVDDSGEVVPPGVPGRILLTDLTNYFMPLLRYEIEDVGSWSDKNCDCGRPFPLLAKIWGRSSDFIVTPEGKLIHSIFFTHLFYDMPDVALFQVNQKSIHSVDVYLVLRPGLTRYPERLLDKRLQQAFGRQMRFAVQVVPQIDRPPSGKHRFTVSSVRASWGIPASSLSERGE